MMMKTLSKTLVALMTASVFVACHSDDVSPINPTAPRVSEPRLQSGTPDNVDHEFQEYIEEFDRDITQFDNGPN